MSAPLACYQSRDATVRQTFFDAAAAAAAAVAASAATGSPPTTDAPPPLPPPPPGHAGRQQHPAGEHSGAGRTGSGHKTSGTSLRDKAAACNTSATTPETSTNSTADNVHDTAALLQLHLQLNQHLQRGQQLVSDADIIRALKRLALNGSVNPGATDAASLPTCAGKTIEQQPRRAKGSASSYTSLPNGYKGHSYGRGGSDRSTVSVRDADSGSSGTRGSVIESATASGNHGGSQTAPSTGSNGPTLLERPAVPGPKDDETAYVPSSLSSGNISQPPAPAVSQQSRSGENTANGKTALQGKQPASHSWRCRACDAVNVGQLGGRCSCCGKPQPPTQQNSGTHMVPQQPGAGRRSQHSYKQLQQQDGIQQQQQNFQLQQLQRDVLLAAVSAAAAAAEKRADEKKAKRAAAAAAAIATESQQQHGAARERSSYSQGTPYLATGGSEEHLGASHNLGKENCATAASGLPAASGGTLALESDKAFELFVTENILRHQHHGHIGSGRLPAESGYEDSTAAAAAAAAAAATLFPGLLQSLEHCSASTLQTKGLSSSLHDASSGRTQQPQLTRAGSDNTNGAASTSYSTPMGLSSELLEAFSPADREEMSCEGVVSCLSGNSGVAHAPSLIGNSGTNCSRESLQRSSIGNAGDSLSLNSSTTGKAPAGAGRVEGAQAFSDGILGDAYGTQTAGACFAGSSSRSRLVGACGSYQGPGENVLGSAPGLTAGKASTVLPGCIGGGCGSTTFSSSALLPAGDTPFDEAATTTGMNIMAFQDFATAPQSTLYGDVITPGADSLNLLGDCRSLSSATPSSLLSRSESNSMFNGRVHVVRAANQRRGGVGDIDSAHSGGDGSIRVERSRNRNAAGTESTLYTSVAGDSRSTTRRDVGVDGRSRGQLSWGRKSAIGGHQSNGRIDQNGIHVQALAVARSTRGHSSHQGEAYAETLGQQPQQPITAPVPALPAGAAVEQPFRQTSLQQQLLQGTGASGDSPQCSGGSDSCLARSSLPLSSVGSSPSAGIGVEEISPLAFTGGSTTAPLNSHVERACGAGALPMDAASLEALLPSFLSPVQILLLEAKEVAERLVEEFTTLGYADPKCKAAEALRSSLAILGYTSGTSEDDSPDDELKFSVAGGKGCIRSGGTGLANGDRSVTGGGASGGGLQNNGGGDSEGAAGGGLEDSCRKSKNANWVQGVGGPHFSAPAMLAHPDEFKNPSSFLKIYGDPMCAAADANSSSPQAGVGGFGGRGGPRSGAGGVSGRSGDGNCGGSNLPIKGHNGNWVCDSCSNVNFPRRFRCNKCGAMRGAQGDAIVAEYAKLVYHQHLKTYRNLASRPGVDLPLKRLQGSAGSGAGNGAGGSGGGNGGAKKGSSSYCSPSSNGGSTTTNSITGSTPSTPSDTANITALQTMSMSTGSPSETSNSASHYSSSTDGVHPAGSEGGRAARGSRLPTAAHSGGGGGSQGAHRAQNSKGQAASEPQSLAYSTRSQATGGAGNGSSRSFPAAATSHGSVAAAATARLQGDASYDDNAVLRCVSQYVSSSPAVSRGSTAKNTRARRASVSGGLPDSSPQTRRRAGNGVVGTAERQRVFGAATGTRSTRGAHISSLDDSKARPDASRCAANSSASDGEKNGKSAGARAEETAFLKEKLSGNKQRPLSNEAGRGDLAGPGNNAVAHSPKDKRMSSVDAKREGLPTMAKGKSAEGTACDGKSSATTKSTKGENLATIMQLETRSAGVSAEGNTNSHVM